MFAQRTADSETYTRALSGLEDGSMTLDEVRVTMAGTIVGGPVRYYDVLAAVFAAVERDGEVAVELRDLAAEGGIWFDGLSERAFDVAMEVSAAGSSDELLTALQKMSNTAPLDYFSPEMDGHLAQEPACKAQAADLYGAPA